jgi:hypothetical protein
MAITSAKEALHEWGGLNAAIDVMSNELAREKIARNLRDAIERLQDDVRRVEIWASALGCFSHPVPDYQPRNDFLLPQAKPGTAYEPRSRERALQRS